MRLAGVILLFVGLVGAIVGTFAGFGSLFAWNGRHAIESIPIAEGRTTHTLHPEPGRRYVIAVEVAFDREKLEAREGVVHVEAKLPLVVRVKDSAGGSLADVVGWLDPNEPPNVLYGQASRASRVMPELRVERLVAPFLVASVAPVTIDVDLGADRVGTAPVAARRLVIHDDALPSNIQRAFMAAALSSIAFVAGVGLLVVGFVRRRAKNRLGTSARKVV